MILLKKVLAGIIMIAFISDPVFSQQGSSETKPTRAQKKAHKARIQQEKKAKKAIHEGKKRHYQLQDKKTRKRMKKNRRKVDKYSPGKPHSFFYREELARPGSVGCLFHPVMPAGSSLQIPSNCHYNQNRIRQHGTQKEPGITIKSSSFQVKEQNGKQKANGKRDCCEQCSSSVGHIQGVMLQKNKSPKHHVSHGLACCYDFIQEQLVYEC